jgi:hypothetical protein
VYSQWKGRASAMQPPHCSPKIRTTLREASGPNISIGHGERTL